MKSFQLPRQLLNILVLLAVVLLVSVFSTVCKAKKAEKVEAPGPDTASTIRSVLGEAKEDYPGIESIEQAGKEWTIYYRFIPSDENALQEELGEALAPKIKELYEKDKAVDVLNFVVSIPFVDELGGQSLKRKLSFVVTRKIFEETDWANLFVRDFLKSVKDLKALE
jgi:hypothetical protein